jgi:hypothetical protein
MKHSILISFLLVLGYAFCSAQTDSTRVSEIRTMILKESKDGGKYDFFTPIKGHEYESVQIKPGLYDSKIGYALIQWGRVNYELGMKRFEDVIDIFSELKGRAANKIEKNYIEIGYNRKI